MKRNCFLFLEAGKLALNLTRGSPLSMKRLQVTSRRGTPRKVIAIRADQILNQNAPSLTSRGPNILKRSSVDNKAGKLFISSLSTNMTVPTLTQSQYTTASEVNNSISNIYTYGFKCISNLFVLQQFFRTK